MEKNSKILQELKEISPLLTQIQHKSPPYTISFSYFDSLADNIVGKLKSGVEPNWYFTKENVYAAPANYFETLPATILQKIKEEEIKSPVFEEMENISPLLNTISKKPVYTVPSGYLGNVTWNKSESAVKQQAKVISFTRLNKFVKYIAAAVIIGLLGIGILFSGKQNGEDATVKTASEVKQLSEQEIIDFLKTTSPADNMVSTTNSVNTKENDIKSSVSKMSDNEIQQFLQENGEQVEM